MAGQKKCAAELCKEAERERQAAEPDTKNGTPWGAVLRCSDSCLGGEHLVQPRQHLLLTAQAFLEQHLAALGVF